MAGQRKSRAAKRPPGMDIYPGGLDALLGREDDASLIWHEGLEEILEAVRTVSGMAKLARVSRRTIERAGIEPSTLYAIQFVRDRRREHWSPLVESRNPLDWRNLTGRYITIFNSIQTLRTPERSETVVDRELPVKQQKRRLRNAQETATLRDITPSERARFHSGHSWSYDMKSGRVTVKMLCSLHEFSRVGFYKWLGTVPRKYQEMLFWVMRDHRSTPPPLSRPALPRAAIRPATTDNPVDEGFFCDREPEVLCYSAKTK